MLSTRPKMKLTVSWATIGSQTLPIVIACLTLVLWSARSFAGDLSYQLVRPNGIYSIATGNNRYAGAAHRTTDDHILRGYYIPKGSIIITNLWCGLSKSHDASEKLTRPGKCSTTLRYMPIRIISIQTVSSQAMVNPRNETLGHVSLASDGGKPFTIYVITRILTHRPIRRVCAGMFFVAYLTVTAHLIYRTTICGYDGVACNCHIIGCVPYIKGGRERSGDYTRGQIYSCIDQVSLHPPFTYFLLKGYVIATRRNSDVTSSLVPHRPNS
jgi:hypothetical protein